MQAPKSLRRPANWQDFETLCKKLWGEIWNCPEIKKNGRSGQDQSGVDVYGIPFGQNDYLGIQCKGKDEYTHKQFTEAEVEAEIEKAKSFQPPLKKFYLVTTAVKDVHIEEFVRQKDAENRKNNLFEVYLFSWEDIVDLIDENKKTHDWYLKSQNFKSAQGVRFVFENDKNELTVEVPFIKKTKHYKQKIVPKNPFAFPLTRTVIPKFSLYNNAFNKSVCRFYFRLHNTGDTPITNYKIFLDFDGDFESIDTCNKNPPTFIKVDVKYDTFIWGEDKKGKIIPLADTLVSDDIAAFDTVCLKPHKEERTVLIKWKLVSTDFKDEGELTLKIKPIFVSKEEIILIEDPLQVRTEEIIEDLLEEIQ